VRSDIATFSIIKPRLNIPNKTTLSTYPEKMTITVSIDLCRIGEFLFQLPLEHLPAQLEGIFEPLDAGVTNLFVSWSISCPGKGALKAVYSLL
jgi:hypothetical protein